MSRTRTASDGEDEHDDGAVERDDRDDDARDDEFPDWVANSAVRLALIAVGLVITIFALGQAVGVNFLGMIADALSTQVGQWLLVALVGILLIVVAQRGFAASD